VQQGSISTSMGFLGPRYYPSSSHLACCLLSLLGGYFSLSDSLLQISNTLGSHMVLQQAPCRATIFGRASSGDVIAITLSPPADETFDLRARSLIDLLPRNGNESATTATDPYGQWKAFLPPVPGGKTAFVIGIINKGTGEKIELEDVVFGDVW